MLGLESRETWEKGQTMRKITALAFAIGLVFAVATPATALNTPAEPQGCEKAGDVIPFDYRD